VSGVAWAGSTQRSASRLCSRFLTIKAALASIQSFSGREELDSTAFAKGYAFVVICLYSSAFAKAMHLKVSHDNAR
jgi:hypothetical protein